MTEYEIQQFLSLRHQHLWLKAFDSHSRIDTTSSACTGGASDKHIISLILHRPAAGALAQSGGTRWCLLKYLLLHKQFCQQLVGNWHAAIPSHTHILSAASPSYIGWNQQEKIYVC